MTLDARSPKEKQWFNLMLGFATAAGVVFYARVAFMAWGMKQLGERHAALKADLSLLDEVEAFRSKVELGNQIGWSLVMLVAAGFLICGGLWMRAMKQRKSGSLG